MKKLTDEELEIMIEYVCKKYRDELFSDIENNLCIEHYNELFGLQMTVDDVQTKISRCRLCNKEKFCVVR